MIYISMDFNEVRTSMDKWPFHSTKWTQHWPNNNWQVHQLYTNYHVHVYTHRRLELELREGERERKRERWEEEVFRDNKPIWSLIYKAIFFFCDHSLSLLSMVSLCTKSMSGLISPRKQNINTKISQIAGMHTRHSSGVIIGNLSRSRWWFH